MFLGISSTSCSDEELLRHKPPPSQAFNCVNRDDCTTVQWQVTVLKPLAFQEVVRIWG